MRAITMSDKMPNLGSSNSSRTEPRFSRVTIALILIGAAIVGAHTLNRSGFCYSRLGWVPDAEKLALAITAYVNKALSPEARAKIAEAYQQQNPDCCRVYPWKEMFGEGDEFVAAGMIPRPTYITIKRNEVFITPYGDEIPVYGGMLAISSCADFWSYWENLPMPNEWINQNGAP